MRYEALLSQFISHNQKFVIIKYGKRKVFTKPVAVNEQTVSEVLKRHKKIPKEKFEAVLRDPSKILEYTSKCESGKKFYEVKIRNQTFSIELDDKFNDKINYYFYPKGHYNYAKWHKINVTVVLLYFVLFFKGCLNKKNQKFFRYLFYIIVNLE